MAAHNYVVEQASTRAGCRFSCSIRTRVVVLSAELNRFGLFTPISAVVLLFEFIVSFMFRLYLNSLLQ